MTSYYPAFLDIRDKPCVLVGGGEVALRKAEALLACGARLSIVASAPLGALRQLALQGGATLVQRDYRDGDLEGAFLAVAATDSPQVNLRVAEEARRRRVLVNVVDAPQLCDFIVPSVIRRGDLTIAVSTGGLSPALSRWVRNELEKRLPAEYEELLGVVAEVREELRRQHRVPPAERWQEALDEQVLESLRKGERQVARAMLLSRLEGQPASQPSWSS